MNSPLHIIILAAGDGTRMKSRLPKVLHAVAGRPLLAHVLDAALALEPDAVHLVHNPEAHALLADAVPGPVTWVPQAERLGTGHAVTQALPHIPPEARVLVLYGDTPLVPVASLVTLVDAAANALALLSMTPPDPTGYGRVVRDLAGEVTGIVEERDADEGQRAIREVNSGILAARAGDLSRWLDAVGNDNSQGEYYLTDVFTVAHAEGQAIRTVAAPDASLLEGANDRVQLAALNDRHRALMATQLMQQGVGIVDPARFDLRGPLEAGRDVILDINVVLEGSNRLGDGVHVGPGCVMRDCDLAAGTRVHPYSVLESVTTHGACDIGPFARLRPGTELGKGAKVGNFVEVKNTVLGEGSKASHLSYLGDSEIGRNVNIGAGTITCNYDGVNKHRTVIGDGAFIGSDTQLVAPVTVGEGATIGAGTTVTRDAPAEQLTVSRAKQVSIRHWKRPKKKES